MFLDGDGQATTRKLKTDLNARLRGVAAVVRHHAGPDCIGVCIEEPFGANPNGAKPLYAMMGAAVLAAEEAGLSWSLINLATLKKHATGKGNAKKEDMIAAAAKRFQLTLDENAADAVHAAAYAVDTGIFS